VNHGESAPVITSRLLRKRRRGHRRRNRANDNRRKRDGGGWQDRQRAKIDREGEDGGNFSKWKKANQWQEKSQKDSSQQPPETTKPPIVVQAATKPPIVVQAATKPPEKVETAPTKKTTQPQEPKTTETPVFEAAFYESTSGVFDVKLPLFSEANALQYSDEKQLYNDLVEAAKYKVNRIVEYNIKNNYYYRNDIPMMAMTMDTIPIDSPPMAMAMSAEAGASSPVAGDVNNYETNKVEESIDEGDAVKTDGKVACARYGDTVVIWHAQKGSYITNITLPALENTNPYPDGGPWPQPRPLPVMVAEEPIAVAEEEETLQIMKVQETKPQKKGNRNKRDLLTMAYIPMKPQVESLLLHDNKLVVIASGYGQSLRSELDYTPALLEVFNTNIRIYDLSALEENKEPPLIKETNVHGRFDSVRADENKVHLVTFSNIDMYRFFDDKLSRYQPIFQNMSDDKYKVAAKKLAEDELIPTFVNQLIKDLSIDGTPVAMTRVCMWQRHLSGTGSELEDATFEGGVMNAYAQVSSFDMSAASLGASNEKSLKVSGSGVLMPSGWGHVYATDKMLVLATQGWDWIETWRGSVQTTYLLGFALLESGKTVPAAVGSLAGSIIGDYSVDVVGKYMRVAVSINNFMWRFQDTPAQEDMPPATENYIRVLKIPEIDDTGACKDSCILEQVGTSESFGLEGELFVGTRFEDNVAYVVTFRQTDPFYVVKFPEETKPVMVGELKKTGFSNYLHFVNEAKTLLLGVGQEADTDGRTLGVQIVLYDAGDPTKPKAIRSFDYTLNPDIRAYSSAQFDKNAFRYVPLEDEKGILIMPMRLDVYNDSPEGNFDGFILFDVSREGITERFSIPHVDPVAFRSRCYSSNSLEDRSFVVNGDVTTMKGHSIRKYNLDTRKPSSDGIDLDQDIEVDPYMGCIFW